MQTKLTLRLDDQTVLKAKQYARNRRTSLSRIVEEYFRRLGGQDIATSTETPVLNEITGLLFARGGTTPEEMWNKCRMRDERTQESPSAIDNQQREAARRHSSREDQWSDLFALGDRQAVSAGLTAADVRREIKAARKRRIP